MSIIKSTKWVAVENSRTRIIRAGQLVKNKYIDMKSTEYREALDVINNWRASHAYPLQVIYMKIKRMAADDSTIIVSQRLKRLESIINKLKRFPNMSLWGIQDLGGCRMVVSSVEEVYNYIDIITSSSISHKLQKQYDYIKNPKASGYRSYHLVYKYQSTKPSKKAYDRNMLIEVQFRTKLQHLWATAVETMGLITELSLKSGEGDETIKRFFILISSAFAIMENTPTVSNTPNSMKKIVKEILAIDKKENFILTLRDFNAAFRYFHLRSLQEKSGYYLLVLNIEEHELSIRYFKPSEVVKANTVYSEKEKEFPEKHINIVLVRAESLNMLQYAYPNYFPNNSDFVNIIEKIKKQK